MLKVFPIFPHVEEQEEQQQESEEGKEGAVGGDFLGGSVGANVEVEYNDNGEGDDHLIQRRISLFTETMED